MDVSIVIVTYNVRKFIGLCIQSIAASIFEGTYEIIIVDNASPDRSADFIEGQFPNVHVLRNLTNEGFAKACNRGVAVSKGQYICFVNPDCMIGTNTLTKCLETVITKSNVGAVAGQILDGGLNILPESKRKLPTKTNSFGRITRLDHLFQNGRLDYYERGSYEIDSKVDVLTGAFLFIEKAKFLAVDGFDEDYFMYAEDIDLCLKLKLLGLDNWYISDIKLIHFKGESSDHKGYDYHRSFYESIYIYLKKHVVSHRIALYPLKLMIFLIQTVRFLFNKYTGSLLDYLLLFGISHGVTRLWAILYYGKIDYYDYHQLKYHFFIYAFILFTGLQMTGYYWDKSKRTSRNVVKGFLMGTILLLIVYALLPAELRFSRMALFLSASSGLLVFLIKRRNQTSKDFLQNIVIWSQRKIADDELGFLRRIGMLQYQIYTEDNMALRSNSNLLIDVDSLSVDKIINLRENNIIIPRLLYWDRERAIIFDSQSGKSRGSGFDDLSIFRLSDEYILYCKRTFDKLLVIFMLTLWPFLFIIKKSKSYIKNISKIWHGKRTFVGYSSEKVSDAILPVIPKGFIDCSDFFRNLDDFSIGINRKYAMHYSVWMDLYCCMIGLFGLIIALTKYDETDN